MNFPSRSRNVLRDFSARLRCRVSAPFDFAAFARSMLLTIQDFAVN